MEKYGFVYIWYDRKHKRYYIGCHWGTEDDGYICSSRWMRATYKRRPEDFKGPRILKCIYTNRQDLLEEEYRWLSMIKDEELRVRYYNLRNHYFGHWTTESDKLTICDKISANTKEAMWSPEVRDKYLEGIKNRDMSYLQNESYKAKRSALGKRNKGRKHTGQALENIRFAARNRGK